MKTKRLKNPLEVSKTSNVILNIIIGLVAFLCVYPLAFIFMISISSEKSIITKGYAFFPMQYSLKAYDYIFKSGGQIIHSYLISIVVTVIGTALAVFLMTLYGYAISRDDFKYRKIFSIIALVPLLFAAGLVPSYLVNTQFLHMQNTLFALILPAAMSPLLILVLRASFKSTIPADLIHAARIDGAGEWKIFYKIVVPLSKPIIATVAILSAFTFWTNNWFNALLYITKPDLTTIQYMLMKLQDNLQFLIQNSSSMGVNAGALFKTMPTDTARMAVVFLVVLPAIFIYPFFQKYFVAGLTLGGIKD